MSIQNRMSTKRISYIDFLKFIGLTGIIIAHIGPPSWLMMARNFDVPFMVILSSILGEKSFERYISNQKSTFSYYLNRIKRLVIPTWIFLVIYFVVLYISTGELFSFEYYAYSFSLTQYGIGYIWIILIYLYSALLIPLFSKIKTSKIGIFLVALVYILYEAAYYFQIRIDNKLIETTFYYIVPYGLLTYLGYNYSDFKKIHKYLIAIFSFIVFITCGIYYWTQNGAFQSVQIAKYPPRFYYLGFGIAVSFLLLLICEKRNFKIYNNKIICYISKHSMWIYLWHILILKIYNSMSLPEIWYLKLLIVYVSSIIVVFIVNKALNLIEKKKTFKFLNYFRG